MKYVTVVIAKDALTGQLTIDKAATQAQVAHSYGTRVDFVGWQVRAQAHVLAEFKGGSHHQPRVGTRCSGTK